MITLKREGRKKIVKTQKIISLIMIAMFVLGSLAIAFSWSPPSTPPNTWLWVDDSAAHFNTQSDLLGDKFNVTLNVFNATQLAAWQFELFFNNTLLNATWVYKTWLTLNNTDWVPYDGLGNFDPAAACENTYNATHGRVRALALMPLSTPFTYSGSAPLVIIEFEIIAAPPLGVKPPDNITYSCDLDLQGTVLGGSSGPPDYNTWDIAHGADDGYYEWVREQQTPGAPVAAFTWSPPSPYTGVTVQFDASATTSGGYPPVTYDWDLDGDGAYGDASIVNPTWSYGTAATYTVKLNATNSLGYWDEEQHDIVVKKLLGPAIDVYTQALRQYWNASDDLLTDYIGKGEFVDCDSFAPGENVTLFANVTYNGDIVQNILVGFEVYDPTGDCVTYRVDRTDVDGIAKVWFRIPIPCDPLNQSGQYFGHWTVIAKAKVQDDIINDTMHFKVGFIVEIINVELLPDNIYYKGEYICANVTYKNIGWMPRWVTLIVVAYDECDVPIGQTVEKFEIDPAPAVLCSSFVDSMELCIEIPKWAYVGDGNLYANAFTELPRNCGIPYCPEVSAPFTIKLG